MLYIVATPIGNLSDLSPRAQEVLRSVTLIAAEDTRHSKRLLQHFGIVTPLLALHSHNEKSRTAGLIARLQKGEDIALVSDAGTPLVSDPGFDLVREARRLGIGVSPIPGPCAAITALSAAGLPCDRFVFEGFLPATANARQKHLQSLLTETRTLVFYEAPHRILAMLRDAGDIFGKERQAVIGRELTKQFESFYAGTLAEVQDQLNADPHAILGEMVVIVAGNINPLSNEAEGRRILGILLAELPLKQAVKLAGQVTGIAKNTLYDWALALGRGC